MEHKRIEFLANLPLLLNSVLDERHVIEMALDHIARELQAERATAFLLDPEKAELEFWALQDGGQTSGLRSQRMPSGRGIVGWVMEHNQAVVVDDVEKDERFFSEIDRESGFKTRDLLCVPLCIHGNIQLGALQVLNKRQGKFSKEDLEFVKQFADQVSLSIHNSLLYRKLKEAMRRLRMLESSRNRALDVLTTELNRPLRLLQEAITRLTEEADICLEAKEELLNQVGEALIALATVQSSAGNLALLGDGPTQIQVTAISLRRLLQDAATYFRRFSRGKQLRFSLEFPDADAKVIGDYRTLQTVLRNLLSNAVRFTANGGSIVLGALIPADMARIYVMDTGIGMRDDEIELRRSGDLVNLQVAESSGMSNEFEAHGLGLGLATAQVLLQAQQSDLDIVSQFGEGTTCSFHLPLAE